jgi:hypothetical protein
MRARFGVTLLAEATGGVPRDDKTDDKTTANAADKILSAYGWDATGKH